MAIPGVYRKELAREVWITETLLLFFWTIKDISEFNIYAERMDIKSGEHEMGVD